ncbi:MAG: helix-turn-helix domain-containing protein [Pseudoclavibacter sp.]
MSDRSSRSTEQDIPAPASEPGAAARAAVDAEPDDSNSAADAAIAPGAASASNGREAALTKLQAITGELSSRILQRLAEQLGWYRDLSAADRSAIGMIAQSGVSSFANWFADGGPAWPAADIFQRAPRTLARHVSLQQALQLIRVSVTVLESFIGENDPVLKVAALEYSRDVAFAAADAYARAAEARGLWDDRLEALVVDSIVSGEYEEDLPSRVSALGWHGVDRLAVLVAPWKPSFSTDRCRRTISRSATDVLIGVQGRRIVLVLGQSLEHNAGKTALPEFVDLAARLASGFGAGKVVLGPTVTGLESAHSSASAAMAAYAVAAGTRQEARVMNADDVLPERALNGDPLARATLIEEAYRPLQRHSQDMLDTLDVYLANGRSLEATARTLYVHPNTVRYRLHRVAELVGWDPTDARDSLILQTACILGRIADTELPAPH